MTHSQHRQIVSVLLIIAAGVQNNWLVALILSLAALTILATDIFLDVHAGIRRRRQTRGGQADA